MMFADRSWWIIGASEGLGRELAQALDAEGARLILSARSVERLNALAESLHSAEVLPMDLRDPQSIETAAQAASEVDGIIYCAGAYEPMRAQDWDIEASVTMTEVNFTAALRVLGGVVPGFAARDHGHVVLIGSLAGYIGLPGAIGYGSSKAALMHLGECLQSDLKGTGVKVQIINPGFIRTRLTEKNSFAMPMIMTAEDAAARCVAAIRSGQLMSSFPAPFSWVFRLAALLPRGLARSLFREGKKP